MPFVSLAPLDAEFLGAALANAPVFCLPDAGHGPALLTVAAALGSTGSTRWDVPNAASFVAATWKNFGVQGLGH